MSRFDALIVDFGGVLTTPLQDSMTAFADEQGIELQDLVRVALTAYAGGEDTLVTDFETGRISDDEFSREFARRLSEASGRPVDPDKIVDRLFGRLRLEDEMLLAIERARGGGLKTGLLSNSWGLGGYPMDRLLPLFDAVVISGEVGMRKPDPEIFHLTTDKLGVEAAGCVFVDDHPGHLKTAAELGMTTVLHRTPGESIPELEGLLGVGLR